MAKVKTTLNKSQVTPKSGAAGSKTPRSRSKRASKTFHQEGKGNLEQEDPKDKTNDQELKKPKQETKKEPKEEKKKEGEKETQALVKRSAKTVKPGPSKKEKEKEQQERVQKWCDKVVVMKAFDINKEFIVYKSYKPTNYTTEVYNKNDHKNRYDDILCMDATRVVLKDRAPEDNYIHANWIMMPDKQPYICTQGPLAATLEDFWHMIYTEKSNVIVMLTALEDDEATSKCTRYFPLDQSQPMVAGCYKISKEKETEEPFPGIRLTILLVEKEGSPPLTVNHFIYDTWTDHTAPQTATAAVRLFWRCRKLAEMAPITVHCSAGIGRSATFIAVDYARQKIMAEGDACKMVEIFREMRCMRFHAIQSAVQYLFLHFCLLEIFAGEGLVANATKYERWIKNYQSLLARVIERNKPADKNKPSKETAA